MKFTWFSLRIGQPTTEDTLSLPNQSQKLKANLWDMSQRQMIRLQSNQGSTWTISKAVSSSPGQWKDITGFEHVTKRHSGQAIGDSLMETFELLAVSGTVDGLTHDRHVTSSEQQTRDCMSRVCSHKHASVYISHTTLYNNSLLLLSAGSIHQHDQHE
jgi:hypothetical protein